MSKKDRIHPSSHPNILGREAELEDLVSAVRRLNHLTILNNADPEATRNLTAQVNELCEVLEKHLPKEEFQSLRQPPVIDRERIAAKMKDAGGTPLSPEDNPERFPHFPYDGFAGVYNPVSLPLEFEWDPPIARGKARFNEIHMGPPGCVHGGFLAGYFDQIFTVANAMNQTMGPTANLTINYRKPTPLDVDLVFEAWVDSISGSRVHTKGRVLNGDVTTVEAKGLFIMLSMEEIHALSERKKTD